MATTMARPEKHLTPVAELFEVEAWGAFIGLDRLIRQGGTGSCNDGAAMERWLQQAKKSRRGGGTRRGDI
jgi:hypothetical protein